MLYFPSCSYVMTRRLFLLILMKCEKVASDKKKYMFTPSYCKASLSINTFTLELIPPPKKKLHCPPQTNWHQAESKKNKTKKKTASEADGVQRRASSLRSSETVCSLLRVCVIKTHHIHFPSIII